ncbi:UNVERIFIED_CONTAM: hypothetical protein Slati_2667400 [Sesamum latifolium]|uniref:Reverse transcriptase domain-containing protein n=1 Tax=Sesamum latifolium TaxID=2727402 RepID=A0AAW2VZM0_9LAMI
MMANEAWMEMWPNVIYLASNPRTSDHSPLILQSTDERNVGNSIFRFDNFLLKALDFLSRVEDVWRHHIHGIVFYYKKTKLLKLVFRNLRKAKGDLARNVEQAAGFLANIQQLLKDNVNCDLLLELEKCCRLVYSKAVAQEQRMHKQRAKLKWLKEGDVCSRTFFLENQSLQSSGKIDLQFLLPWVKHTISNVEAAALSQNISDQEVKEAMFDIAEDKSTRLDGLSSGFFKAAWSMVGAKVTKAVKEFYSTGCLLKQVNESVLALIPKFEIPREVADYRPIACCNVIYKVIMRIMVTRMKGVLQKLIDSIQNAFVPGRSISGNILSAQELLLEYNQMRLPPRCALKINLKKAYDTVEWGFVTANLKLISSWSSARARARAL